MSLLGNKRWQFISIPLFAIVCSFIAASIIILIMGKNPLSAFYSLLQGGGFLPKPNYAAYKSVFTDFMDTMDALAVMILASLSVVAAFRAGLFNIGVSGQMLLSGFVATVLIGYSDLPSAIAKPLVIVIGIVVGALVGALIGYLKHKFNINEVVAAIMLNYLFQYTISYVINTRLADPVSRQSREISTAARLTLVGVQLGGIKMRVPLAIILAILCAIALLLFFTKTKQGYEMKAVGLNMVSSRYAGINTGKTTVVSMIMSGALAGLAGTSYYLGYYASIQPNVLSSTGFDSIAVALLGNSHPIGVIFSSLLITALSRGGTYMSSIVGIRQEISSLIVGIILLFSACGSYIRHIVDQYDYKSERGQS
jgi:simple sugar transport system permease protein